MEIDPWKAGAITDYARLFSQFGISPMEPFKKKYSDNRYIRRNIIFGHRDFGRIDSAITAKKPFIMMTGLMPSGRFHFGHKMVADEIIWLQENGAHTYIAAADIESLIMRGVSTKDAKKIAVEEYLTNYIALGLDPEKLNFWFQSAYKIPYYRLADEASAKVTLNELKAIYGTISPGKMTSVMKQVADILHTQLPDFDGKMASIVPVGADQDPHIRLTRDIAARFKGTYDFISPSATFHRFMEGLQGGKMSSSDPKSHIALLEDPSSAKKKIMSCTTGGRPTLEEQKKLGGKPDECSAYKFMLYHLEDDDKKLAKWREECECGVRRCGDCKKECAEALEKFLLAHQEKAKEAREIAKNIAEESIVN